MKDNLVTLVLVLLCVLVLAGAGHCQDKTEIVIESGVKKLHTAYPLDGSWGGASYSLPAAGSALGGTKNGACAGGSFADGTYNSDGTPHCTAAPGAYSLPAAGAALGGTKNGACAGGSFADGTYNGDGTPHCTAAPAATSNACTDNPAAGVLPTMNTAGHVYCLDGAYTFTTAKTVSAAGVTIRLTGRTSITRSSGVADMLDVTGVSDHIYCEPGAALDGGGIAGGALVDFTGSTDFVIDGRCSIQHYAPDASGTPAIYATGAVRASLLGIQCKTGTDHLACIRGLSTTALDDLTIKDGFFISAGSAPQAGMVYLSNGTAGASRNVLFAHNMLFGHGDSTVNASFYGPAGPGGLNIQLIGNRCEAVGGLINGCLQIFGCEGCAVLGNTFVDNGNTSYQGMMRFGDFYRGTVSGNTVQMSGGGHAMDFIDGSENTVSANTVYRCGVGFGGSGCIRIYSNNGQPCSKYVVANNVLMMTGASTYGIEFSAGGNTATCEDNRSIGNIIIGDGTSTQTGILVQANGGVMNVKSLGDTFVNMGKGVDVQTGVTVSSVLDPSFDTVSTPFTFASGTAVKVRYLDGLTFSNIPANVGAGSLLFVSDAVSTCLGGTGAGFTCFYNGSAWAH